MTTAVWSNKTNSAYNVGEPVWNPKYYRCHLAILREDDGTISVVVLNLPGCGSCGSSEEEAITNCREAISGAVSSYLGDGEDIPWHDPLNYEIPEGAKQKWILVNV